MDTNEASRESWGLEFVEQQEVSAPPGQVHSNFNNTPKHADTIINVDVTQCDPEQLQNEGNGLGPIASDYTTNTTCSLKKARQLLFQTVFGLVGFLLILNTAEETISQFTLLKDENVEVIMPLISGLYLIFQIVDLAGFVFTRKVAQIQTTMEFIWSRMAKVIDNRLVVGEMDFKFLKMIMAAFRTWTDVYYWLLQVHHFILESFASNRPIFDITVDRMLLGILSVGVASYILKWNRTPNLNKVKVAIA